MMIETLRFTPVWVWAVLMMLTALGVAMMRTRIITQRRLTILPIAMVLYSFCSALLSFGARPAYSLAWLAGLAVAFVVIRKFAKPSNAHYLAASHSFEVPGSAIPLLLILTIFVLKYVVGVLKVRAPSIVAEPLFAALACAMLGALCAAFLARGLAIQATRQRNTGGPTGALRRTAR